MMKKNGLVLILIYLLTLSWSVYAEKKHSSEQRQSTEKVLPAPIAPYLMTHSPTFDITLEQFRKEYNALNPKQMINEYQIIVLKNDKTTITRAASKINEQFYSSAALEKSSNKIKSMQFTYLPTRAETEKTARTKAISYMAAVMCWFDLTLSQKQCRTKINTLLTKGKSVHFYQQTEGTLRYIVVDNGENGITFAIEPVKLSLSE